MSLPDARALLLDVLSESSMALLDAWGRPLGEYAAPAAYRAAGVREVACPFEGSRALAGLPINAAAARQVAHAWPQLLDALGSLTRSCAYAPPLHDAARGAGPHRPSSLLSGGQVWLVCVAAQIWPLLCQLRQPERPIALPLAALFKITLGFSSFIPMMLLAHEGLADSPLLALLDAAQCYELLEREQWLVGSAQSCAGSPGQIQRCYEGLCVAPDPSAPLQVDPALPDAACALDLAQLAQEAHVALLAAGLTALSFARRNALHECPGYGQLERHERWPLCMHIAQVQPVRLTRALGAMPELRLTRLHRLFEDASAVAHGAGRRPAVGLARRSAPAPGPARRAACWIAAGCAIPP